MAGMEDIKELRARTGAGILDCKKALAESGDDLNAAVDWLRAKGIAKAAKKADRVAAEGACVAYIHAGGKIGVLVEVNCETDFAAKSPPFQELTRDLAMHIAAAAPEYVRREEIPGDRLDRERAIQRERVIAEGKPAAVADKIVEGRLGKFYSEICLLDQVFVKSDKQTIQELLTEAIAKIGENIQVRRFSRYVLGEGIEKKTTDFAAEVAAAVGDA